MSNQDWSCPVRTRSSYFGTCQIKSDRSSQVEQVESEYFWTQNFLNKKSFLIKHFFLTHFFYFGTKFFGPKIFWIY